MGYLGNFAANFKEVEIEETFNFETPFCEGGLQVNNFIFATQ